MTFRERLKEEIEYKGYTLSVVADKVSISKRTLDSYVDSRGIIPPADTAVRYLLNILLQGKIKPRGIFRNIFH